MAEQLLLAMQTLYIPEVASDNSALFSFADNNEIRLAGALYIMVWAPR